MLNKMLGSILVPTTVFSPASLSNLVLWTPADQLTGLSDGDPVSTFTDRSGNGNDITAVTTTRPLYKTNIINGKPALLFDGTDDFMSVPSTLNGTLFIVAYYTLALFDSFDGLWTTTLSAGGSIYILGSAVTADWFGGHRASVTLYKDGTATESNVTNAPHVFTSSDSVPQTGTWVVGKDRDLGLRFWNGYVAEVVMYSDVKSAGDRSLVTAYLGAKYGLTVA